jgi:hypothetical protein
MIGHVPFILTGLPVAVNFLLSIFPVLLPDILPFKCTTIAVPSFSMWWNN